MAPPAFLSRLDTSFRRFQRKGDARALGLVFDGAAPEMLRVARGFARGDESLAEDAVQAAFLAAMEKSAEFDARRRVMPWLLGLLAIELRRERANAMRTPNPAWLREGAERRSPTGPELAATGAELKELIRCKVSELPETYRSAVEQHLFSNADAATIARRLGISGGALHVRVHRGLGLLRGLLPAGAALGAGLVLGDVRGLASVRATVMGTGAAAGVGAAAATASGGIFAGSQLGVAAATVVGLMAGGTAVAVWQAKSEADPGNVSAVAPQARATIARPLATPGETELAPVRTARPPAPVDIGIADRTDPATRDWLGLYLVADGYTEIFILGLQLAALPGSEGLEIARAVYPRLDSARRKQFAKPFVFRKGAPWGLDVVDLIARDEDPSVRGSAWSFLRPFAFRDFAKDPGAYASWRARTAGLTRREVLLQSARDLALRCSAAAGNDEIAALLMGAQPPAMKTLKAVRLAPHELFRSTGFSVQLVGWLAAADEPLVLAALPWTPYGDLPESSYRSLVLPLLDSANSAIAAESARVLARSGRAFAADELLLRFGEIAEPSEDDAQSPAFWIRWTHSER